MDYNIVLQMLNHRIDTIRKLLLEGNNTDSLLGSLNTLIEFKTAFQEYVKNEIKKEVKK